MPEIPVIDVSDPAVLRDPLAAFSAAREQAPVARLALPGVGTWWAVTRYAEVRAMLTDRRFALGPDSYPMRPEVPGHCAPYVRTMAELEGAEHARLRRLVSPSFTARRAATLRSRIERIVDGLLDALDGRAGQAGGGTVDLLDAVARPLPMEVICELVGIDPDDPPAWRRYGAAVAAGHGTAFAEALPAIVADARAAVAHRTDHPGEDLLSELVGVHDEDGGRLTEAEVVAVVWHLLLAGQTPTNLIANAVAALLEHPDQLAALRADESLMPGAVEELTRWCPPQPLSVPRTARADVDLGGVAIAAGDVVTAALACANRDPRVFDDPERLDLRRPPRPPHVAYGHGPHVCLGAALARVQTEAALSALVRRYPHLELTEGGAPRVPDPGTSRLAALVVRLGATP